MLNEYKPKSVTIPYMPAAKKQKSAPQTTMPMGVGGIFYPAEERECVNMLAWCAQHQAPVYPQSYKAIVMPHAGWRYSGMVAHSAIASVLPYAANIKRIVILGPTHKLNFQGIATTGADGFATPLGMVNVDKLGVDAVLKCAGVEVLEQAFDGEHSLEVELPFLAQYFPNVKIVPLIVGDASLSEIVPALKALWGGDETLIIISSDLSHYLPQEKAKLMDADTAKWIETLNIAQLTNHHACGFRPLAGAMAVAQELGLRATRLDMRTSGDTAGNMDRVVGYGAWGFQPARTARLDEHLRKQVLDVAKQTLAYAVAKGYPPHIDVGSFPMPLQTYAKTFVTLKQNGRLRGCIGSMEAVTPLIKDVMMNSFKAGFSDPRFKPITKEELPGLDVSVSILSHPQPMMILSEADLVNQLEPDVDGLIINSNGKQALFLPSVWEDIHHPRDFVRALKRKAGMEDDYWADDFQAWRYSAEKI